MKKGFLLASLVVLFANCSNDYNLPTNDADVQTSNLPETRVFIQGKMINGPLTKGSLAWPYVSDEGWESARFSIRADGTFPGYIDQSSTLYFGRKPGKDGKNRGKVLTAYPYGHYNDRDLDYYLIDKKTGNNIGLFRYVYDPQGLITQNAILEAPLVVDILADEVEDLEKAIAAGTNVSTNTKNLAKVNALLDLGSDYLESHVLWYVVKEVGMKNGWHVNGIISDEPVGEPDKVADNVEVDIHQQEHADWNEIKTTVHVRTDAESVKINIPLNFDDIVENDDFNIRIYQDYISSDNPALTGATVEITHDENGITIDITNIDYEAIKGYKASFGDGLTVEIHSYCTNDDQEEIWKKVQKSVVVSTGKPCTVVGQITSAFNDEIYPVFVKEPKK